MSKGTAPQRTGVLRLRQLSSYLLPLDEGSRSQKASLNKERLSSGVNEGWAWTGMRDGPGHGREEQAGRWGVKAKRESDEDFGLS